ncbi:hypothetical protein Nepgr_008077 [Nepenthes gracilis]|uniref:Uncharacterized protein n=1 Tax=Nepenthes gracilis TaxID=150966 RepID=A0AAD3XIV8_NEPGR|nr:hypothetical protein Nepgr_008077 [Nepenthes gracilis]
MFDKGFRKIPSLAELSKRLRRCYHINQALKPKLHACMYLRYLRSPDFNDLGVLNRTCKDLRIEISGLKRFSVLLNPNVYGKLSLFECAGQLEIHSAIEQRRNDRLCTRRNAPHLNPEFA